MSDGDDDPSKECVVHNQVAGRVLAGWRWIGRRDTELILLLLSLLVVLLGPQIGRELFEFEGIVRDCLLLLRFNRLSVWRCVAC